MVKAKVLRGKKRKKVHLQNSDLQFQTHKTKTNRYRKKWNGVGPSLKVQMLMVSEGTINELAEQLMNNAKMSKAYCYFISHPV